MLIDPHKEDRGINCVSMCVRGRKGGRDRERGGEERRQRKKKGEGEKEERARMNGIIFTLGSLWN